MCPPTALSPSQAVKDAARLFWRFATSPLTSYVLLREAVLDTGTPGAERVYGAQDVEQPTGSYAGEAIQVCWGGGLLSSKVIPVYVTWRRCQVHP